MVSALAPNSVRMGVRNTSPSTVSSSPQPTSSTNEVFCTCSASWMSPRPRATPQMGAPPMPNRPEKAEMTVMTGMHSPTPVSGSALPPMWPMKMRSTTL